MSTTGIQGPVRRFVAERPLLCYFALAYAISWSYWIPMAIQGKRIVNGAMPTHLPGLLGPALAAVIVSAISSGGSEGVGALLRLTWRVSRPVWKFWLYALSPLLFLAFGLLLAVIFGQPVSPLHDFALYPGIPDIGLAPVFGLVLLVNGFGEELGWRGFALPRLQRRFGPLGGTLALALLWAGWHAPLFVIVENFRQMGVVLILGGFLFGLIMGALVLSRVVHVACGSVLMAALWHATYNMTSATSAASGFVAAVSTTCAMIWGAVLLVQEWRRRKRGSLLAVEMQDRAVQ